MPPRPTVYDDALRLRLETCAAAAIAESGYDEMSVRKVAAAAGTSTSAMYALFGSKESLVQQVVSKTVDSFVLSQEAVAADPDPVQNLKGLGRAYRHWALANPDMYRLMFGARLLHPEAAPHSFDDVHPGIHPLIRAIRRGIDSGAFATQVRPEDIATMMWAQVHGFVSLELAQWQSIPLAERSELFETTLASGWSRWA